MEIHVKQNGDIGDLQNKLAVIDVQLQEHLKLKIDDSEKLKSMTKEAISIQQQLFDLTGSLSGLKTENKPVSLVAELQKQLRETENEYDKFRGKNQHLWESEEWHAVHNRVRSIRLQLFELTGDYYGTPKKPKIKPCDAFLDAEYDAPWDVPKDVLDWLRTSSLLFSDATDAVRWSRIINTLNDERYEKGDLTIYRALESGYEIRPGDWVTTSREYAQQHLEKSLNGRGNILEETVDGRDVLVSPTGNYEEAIYAPREYSMAIEDWPKNYPPLSQEWFDLHFDKGVPDLLRQAAESLCIFYGIKDVCDPMYMTNAIAFELGWGDGKGSFFAEKPEITEDVLLKTAERLCFAYSTATGGEKPEIMVKHLSDALGLPEECEERFSMD